MRIFRTAVIPFTLAWLASASALHAQKAGVEWQALKKEAEALQAAGKYDLALVAAKKALAIAEKKAGPQHPETAASLDTCGAILVEMGQLPQAESLHKRALAIQEQTFGPEHPELIPSLNNLAGAYWAQGRYAQAVPPIQRVLAITEKSKGLEHPDLAEGLNNLAELYIKLGRYPEAEALDRRALAIREKSLGPEHPDVATSLNGLVMVHYIQGQYAQAETLAKRALAIREKSRGPDHPEVAKSLNNLGQIYNTQGQYALAEPLYQRALAILEKTKGPDHPEVAHGLNLLGMQHSALGQFASAESLLKRALAILEKWGGPEHPDVATGLNNLAALYVTQGQYALAEPLYRRALAIREKTAGPEHPAVAISLNNLAMLHATQGQYAQAESLYKRSLAIMERHLGPDHPDVATSLNNLAWIYRTLRQNALAEALYKRALAIYEKSLGPDHPDVALCLNNLGELYRSQGLSAQAEPLHLRALAIREKALGSEHPDVAMSLNNLALQYATQGQNAKAEPMHLRALLIREKSLGLDHPDVATSLNNLASVYNSQKQYARAEPMYRRALEIQEKSQSPDHPLVALGLNSLAEVCVLQGQYAQAIALSRRSSAIYRQRILAGGTSDAAVGEATQNQDGFYRHLGLLSRNPGDELRAKITDEAFQVVQLAQASGTASALAKMAARFAKGEDALATLIKRKQDAADRVVKLETRLVAASSKPPKQRNASDEARLREDIAAAGRDIEAIDAELNARFPEYQALTRPEPLTIDQVRLLLRHDEAMVVFEVTPVRTWMWVVRAGKAVFIPLDANGKDLAEDIKKIRARMEVGPAGQVQSVDVATLHALFRRVFAPALPHLAKVRHVMLVPSGPLQSLPFAMLVASPPKGIKSGADYRRVEWLAKRYALSVLPSVGSIRGLRQFARPGQAQEPFIGFGDPSLKEMPAVAQPARTTLRLAGLFRGAASPSESTQTLNIADVEVIRQQDPLPESAEEIRAMARITKAGPDSIWLRDRATERNVKTLDLAKYRMVVFATHGVMANELGTGMEPGLLLTPPEKGTPEDDGYLAAGEIARLKLNADWVLLSACNTAAADGSPGAEGLSGLAKAFFYAGSRSLLVSHWPVASDATVALTTTMLQEYEAHPSLGKAEAHRRAVLKLMHMPDRPEYAHPFFWAPFVVVGEGGRTNASLNR